MDINKLEEVKKYFKAKAKDYDLVEQQVYWNLSDNLLWYMIRHLVLDKFKNKKIKVLDAGGGTGRWLIKIINYLDSSEGVIYDISEDMLSVAKNKITKMGLDRRISTINGNLENMDNQADNQYDLVICFHNVLGFVNDTKKVFSEMTRILKKNGYLILVVPNKYHTLFFNIFIKRLHVLDKIVQKNEGSFTDKMPDINLFTPSSIRKLYKTFNFTNVKIFGFPITIYPELEETKIIGNTENIKQILSDTKTFKKIEKIEKSLIFNEEAAARGNNLLAIGQKNS